MMTAMEVLSRNQRDIAKKSVDIMKTESIVTQETNIKRGLDMQRSVGACLRIGHHMAILGRRKPWTDNTNNHTTTAILFITTNLRRTDQREEFHGANPRSENRYDVQCQNRTAHPNMNIHPAIDHQGTATQRALVRHGTPPRIAIVRQDIALQMAIARQDMDHRRPINHLGDHHLRDIGRKGAPGLPSDSIEICFIELRDMAESR